MLTHFYSYLSQNPSPLLQIEDQSRQFFTFFCLVVLLNKKVQTSIAKVWTLCRRPSQIIAQITESVRRGEGGSAMSHTRVSFLIPNQLAVLLPPPPRSHKMTPHQTFCNPTTSRHVCLDDCFLHRTFTLRTVFINLVGGGQGFPDGCDHWLTGICGLHVCSDGIGRGRCSNHFGLAARNELGQLAQAEITAQWSSGSSA